MSKPTQTESHRAKGEFLYLDFALKAKLNVGLTITDPLMIQLLPNFDDKTIRRIRKKFMNNGFIEQIGKKLPNKSIEYDFTVLGNALKERQRLEELFMNKQEPDLVHNPTGVLLKGFTDLSEYYIVKYELKNESKPIHLYPKRFYQKKLCPTCGQHKLRKFKHDGHDLDMKCPNCKLTFYFYDWRLVVKN